MPHIFKSVNLFNFVENINHTQTPHQIIWRDKFISRYKKVHGDKYDYSKMVYKKASEKIKIICPIHGEFEQIANNHLRGCGCPTCGGKLKMTTEEFIEKATQVHGDKYDYSKVYYMHSKQKVIIICPIHGEFLQSPNQHLSGGGCSKCAKENLLSSTEEFIEKSKNIHQNKYDYSKVDYKNNTSKVKIICPIHGVFEQRPAEHIQGCGCQKCGELLSTKNSRFISGQYHPQHPEKYDGDVNNIIYRSSYELKAFHMIEEDKNTIYWGSETVKIPYEFECKQRNYIVDLKIETKDKITLIEIKPYRKTIKPKYDYDIDEWEMNNAKWKSAKEYCSERNWDFEIWTENELGI